MPGLVSAALGVGLFSLGAWEPLERLAQTGLFWFRDLTLPMQWDDRVVVIAIDDASLAEYGAYPWPRSRYADLLDKLMAVQPAAIGFDILMPEATSADPFLAEALLFSGNAVLAIGDDGRGNALQVTPR